MSMPLKASLKKECGGECVSVEGRFKSLVVISFLAQEYFCAQNTALKKKEEKRDEDDGTTEPDRSC
jgi:hypothetical protein